MARPFQKVIKSSIKNDKIGNYFFHIVKFLNINKHIFTIIIIFLGCNNEKFMMTMRIAINYEIIIIMLASVVMGMSLRN